MLYYETLSNKSGNKKNLKMKQIKKLPFKGTTMEDSINTCCPSSHKFKDKTRL